MEEQKRLFRKLNKNHDGNLTKQDLILGFEETHCDMVINIDEIMNLVDMSCDGSINYSEWLVATTDRALLLSQNKLKQAFQYFDKNDNG